MVPAPTTPISLVEPPFRAQIDNSNGSLTERITLDFGWSRARRAGSEKFEAFLGAGADTIRDPCLVTVPPPPTA